MYLYLYECVCYVLKKRTMMALELETMPIRISTANFVIKQLQI